MSPIGRMLAEQEIHRLVTAYALANDDGDWDALAATLAEDARFIRPSGGEPVVGRDAIRDSYASRPARLSRHLITNILVAFDGDSSATCRSTMLLYVGGEDGKAASPALLGGFRDRLIKTAAGWRFSERFGFLDLRIA